MSDNLKFHEAANIFPLLEGDELHALAADIKANGLQKPIELLDGQIIDGRNRKTACLLAGVEPRFVTIKTKDPVAYVMSMNAHRRHLTPSQRSMAAARAKDYYEKQAKERMQAGQSHGGKARHGSSPANLPESTTGDARDQAGKALGVSGRSVDYASKVIEQGTPELVKAVDDGRMAVSTAAILASEPPEVQRREANAPKRNRRYTSGANGTGEPEEREPESEPEPGKIRGVGVLRANEAIDALKRIPKNDQLRKRGFQIVTDWIRANK